MGSSIPGVSLEVLDPKAMLLHSAVPSVPARTQAKPQASRFASLCFA